MHDYLILFFFMTLSYCSILHGHYADAVSGVTLHVKRVHVRNNSKFKEMLENSFIFPGQRVCSSSISEGVKRNKDLISLFDIHRVPETVCKFSQNILYTFYGMKFSKTGCARRVLQGVRKEKRNAQDAATRKYQKWF